MYSSFKRWIMPVSRDTMAVTDPSPSSTLMAAVSSSSRLTVDMANPVQVDRDSSMERLRKTGAHGWPCMSEQTGNRHADLVARLFNTAPVGRAHRSHDNASM